VGGGCGEGCVPIVVGTITTLVASTTLIFSPILAIRDFGIYSVVGIVSIFIVSLTFIPAMLVLLTEPRRARPGGTRDRRMTRVLERLVRGAVQRRRGVLWLAAGVCLVSLWGATRIRVHTDYLGFFNPHSQVRRDNQRIAESLGGTQPIYVVIDGGAPQSVKRLEVLVAMKDLQRFIRSQPGVDSTLSLVDYVGVVQAALN